MTDPESLSNNEIAVLLLSLKDCLRIIAGDRANACDSFGRVICMLKDNKPVDYMVEFINDSSQFRICQLATGKFEHGTMIYSHKDRDEFYTQISKHGDGVVKMDELPIWKGDCDDCLYVDGRDIKLCTACSVVNHSNFAPKGK